MTIIPRASCLRNRTGYTTAPQNFGKIGWSLNPSSPLTKVQMSAGRDVLTCCEFGLCTRFRTIPSPGGFYTEELPKKSGYRVLILNTNLYYDQNKVTENILDPAGQFEWMDAVLTSAASKNEKVFTSKFSKIKNESKYALT